MNAIGPISTALPHPAASAPQPVRQDRGGEEAHESAATKAAEAAHPNKVDLSA